MRLKNQVLGVENRGGVRDNFVSSAEFYDSRYRDKNYNNRGIVEMRAKKKLKDRMFDTKNKDTKSSRTLNIKKLLSEVRLGMKPNTGIEINSEKNIGKNLPTIWQIGSEPHNFQKETGVDTDHFASFPQALVEIPIKFGCPKNGIVLDCFMGSGTSAIVAKKLGRNYIGIELNPKYIQIAQSRLNATPTPLL